MPEMIQIQNSQIQIKEYRGKRVVTFKDIDTVHQRPDGTARRNFNQNRKRFISGVDFYTVKPSDFQKYEIRPAEINNNGTTLITESGYLMLVKSFTDDLAWKVQRELVDTYFRTRSETMSQTITVTETAQTEIENYEIFLEAARIMATIPNSQQYVINCLRHVIPDIDETWIKQNVAKVKRLPDKRNNNYFRLGVDIDTEKLLVTMYEKDLSVHEVARRAQVCVTTVEGWIAGRHKPVLQNRINLCRALGENENFLTPRRQRRKK